MKTKQIRAYPKDIKKINSLRRGGETPAEVIKRIIQYYDKETEL